ncbi:hypothetical protein REPUB_Repub20aG0095400 [Reevesia pubescens]
MKGMCEGGKVLDEVQVFDKMFERGFQGDGVLYEIITNGLCTIREPAMALELHRMMERMSLFSKMLSKGINPDVVYGSLINGFSRLGQLDEATKLFGSFADQGLELYAFSYNTMINGYCKRQVSTAKKMFNEMHVYGQSPILSTYAIMLAGLCKNGQIEEAVDLFHSLESTKDKPSIELFSILIDGVCKAGRMEESRKMSTEIPEKGLVPDVVTYNIMLNGLGKKSMSLEADNLLMEMEEKGCLPDSISFNVIINGFLREKEVKKAMNHLEEMRRRSFSPDEAITSMLLRLAKDAECLAARVTP